MKATLIKTDGTVVEIEPLNGETFELQELYKLLDCELVEVVNLRRSENILIIDEEGKYSQKFINEAATVIARNAQGIYPTGYIVGDAILCHSDMLD